MPKFFCVSDIHGYYDEMIEALNEAGFDPNNSEHILVGCGDYNDRGPDSVKVVKYLHSLPNKVLVAGNHEKLFVDLCERGFPYDYDIHNGTWRAVLQLGYGDEYDEMCKHALTRMQPFLDSMVNYFETKNYIFVHSWIPMKNKDGFPAHYTRGRKFEFDPDWRYAHQSAWDEAAWGNPYKFAEQGLLPDKTLVFGHWHCSTGWAKDEGRSEFGDDAKFDIFYGDGFISIDACTAHSGKVNVLVIEDDLLDN